VAWRPHRFSLLPGCARLDSRGRRLSPRNHFGEIEALGEDQPAKATDGDARGYIGSGSRMLSMRRVFPTKAATATSALFVRTGSGSRVAGFTISK